MMHMSFSELSSVAQVVAQIGHVRTTSSVSSILTGGSLESGSGDCSSVNGKGKRLIGERSSSKHKLAIACEATQVKLYLSTTPFS